MAHLPEWEKYKTPSEFAARYNNTEDAWKELVVYAMKDSINLTKVPRADKQEIEDRIKAYLARFRWRTQGFYEVSNSVDDIVTAAKKEIRK
jgi:carboxyl-terminal processing protease